MDATTAATISHPHASKALCAETPSACTLSGSLPRVKRSTSLIGSSKPIRASSNPSKQRAFSLHRRSSTEPAYDLDQHTLELAFRSLTTPEQRFKLAGIQQMAKEKSMTNAQDAEHILQSGADQDSDPVRAPALIARSVPEVIKEDETGKGGEWSQTWSDDRGSVDSASSAPSTNTPSPPTLLSDYASSQLRRHSSGSKRLSSVGTQVVDPSTDSSNTLGLGRGPRGGALVGRSLSTNDLNSLLLSKPTSDSLVKQRYFSTDSVSSDDSSPSVSGSRDQPFSPRQFEDAPHQVEPVAMIHERAWGELQKPNQLRSKATNLQKQSFFSAEPEGVFSPRQFEDAIHQYEPLHSVPVWTEAIDNVGRESGAYSGDTFGQVTHEVRAATHEAPELVDVPADNTASRPDTTPPMSPDSNNLDLHLRSATIALEELRESVLQRPRAPSSHFSRSSTFSDGIQILERNSSPFHSMEDPIARHRQSDHRQSERPESTRSLVDEVPSSSGSALPGIDLEPDESPKLRGRSALREDEFTSGGKLRRRRFGETPSQSSGLAAAAKKGGTPINMEDADDVSSSKGAVSKLVSRSPSLIRQEGMGGGIGLGLFEITHSKVERVEDPDLSKKDSKQVFYDAREALYTQNNSPSLDLAQPDAQEVSSSSPAQAADTSDASASPKSQPVGSDTQPDEQYRPSTSKIDHTTSSKKQFKDEVPGFSAKKKKSSTTMHGRHYNVTGNSSRSDSPNTNPSTSWSCTTTASNPPKTKSWTSALAASSVPSSPQLLASPTMGSASGSPMLNGTPTMSAPGTPMETQSAFGGEMPVQAHPAATPAYDGASGAANDSAPGFQASVATVIAASAIGSLMLIGAIIWAALFRRRRSKRRRHLAGVLEKFGSASTSDFHSDTSSKSSISLSRSSKDTLADNEKRGMSKIADENKVGMGHIGAGIGYGTSDFGKVVSAKPVESKSYFVAQRASARASALNIVSPWIGYDGGNKSDSTSRAGSTPNPDAAAGEDGEAARHIGSGLLVDSGPHVSSRMSKDLARSGLVSEALAPIRDATFSWQHPTLSLPPAAARALATGHYVKKRTTLPAKSRVPVPPMIAPLSSLGANPSSTLSKADSEASIAVTQTEAYSSSSWIDTDTGMESTVDIVTQSGGSGNLTAGSQPALSQRVRSDSSTTAGGSVTTISNNGSASSLVATDGSRNGWLFRMLGGLQSSSTIEDSNLTSATQSSNGDSAVSASVSDGEFAEVRFVTARASLGHGSASPQLQSIGSGPQSKRYSNNPLLAMFNSGVSSQDIAKQQVRVNTVPSGTNRRNPNWHSSLPACREESEETVFVIGDAPIFGSPNTNVSKASALIGRGLGDLVEDTSGSEDERKSGYDGGGETDAESRTSAFVPIGNIYKNSNDGFNNASTQASRSSFLDPHGRNPLQQHSLSPIRVPSITLTLEDETLGEIERPLSLASHSESGTTSEEEFGTDERIMAMVGRAPAYNPHINPRVGSSARESTQSAASFFSSNSSDEENDTEDAYNQSGRISRANDRSSRSSKIPQPESNHQDASRTGFSRESYHVGEGTPRNSNSTSAWPGNKDSPDSETDASGVHAGEMFPEEQEDGYGSESAEGCLELSDFPTLPSWTPAERAAHAAARADKSAYRSQSANRRNR